MKSWTRADYGYWALVGILLVAIVAMVGLIAVNIVIPELQRADAVAASSAPAPTQPVGPTASPLPSGMVRMGEAVIPGDTECAGCHETSAGTIGLDSVPVMGHAQEGWGKCTSCHATAKLVDTAPGHTGIHASECTVCHKAGDPPTPLSRPHRDDQNLACLSCHGSEAPLPEDMTHRSEAVCWLCHRLPTVEPPVPAHETAPGEADCRTCHVADGEAGKLPDDHLDRPATLCLSCHEVALGATPGSSPRIKTWPAPSASPEALMRPLVPLTR